MAFQPIKKIELAAARRQAELNAIAAEKKVRPERAGLYTLGRVTKYAFPILTSLIVATVFLLTPGFSSVAGLLFYLAIGGGGSTLISRGLSKSFNIAKFEREIPELENKLQDYKDERRAALDEKDAQIRGLLEAKQGDANGLQAEIQRLMRANQELSDERAELEEAIRSGVSGLSIDGVNFLTKKIGRGGMAAVWEVFSKALAAKRAWKAPLPELVTNPFAVERFLREARGMVAMEEHAGVVKCFDLKEISRDTYRKILEQTGDASLLEGVQNLPAKIPCIVMEYIKHPTLSTWLHEKGTLSPLEALSIAVAIAEVLQEVNQKVVHRDLKPDNIFVIPGKKPGEYKIKISDFGLVKFLVVQQAATGTPGLTQAGSLVGTPEYMSYEQRYGSELDWKTDLYALGAMLYEMLAGRLLFGQFNPDPKKEFWKELAAYNQGAIKIAENVQGVISQLPMPGLPDLVAAQLRGVLRRMMDHEHKKRYKNWTDCINDLNTILKSIASKKTSFPPAGIGNDATDVAQVEYGPGGQIIGVGPKKK
jgi:serine/threonine protein kinase